MLDHPKLILVQFDDLAYLLAADIFQPILLDKLLERFLSLPDEVVRGDCGADSIAQLVKPYVFCQFYDLGCLTGVFLIAVFQLMEGLLLKILKVMGSTSSAQFEESRGLTTLKDQVEQLCARTNQFITQKGRSKVATFLGMGQGS